MSDYYQFRDEKGTPIDYYQLVNDNNELCEEIERLKEDYAKEKYLVDKYTRQLTDEYKNTEYQCKEKERLNNIINELEKYIKTDAKIELYKDVSGFRTFVDGQDLLNKLQELKGSEKE